MSVTETLLRIVAPAHVLALIGLGVGILLVGGNTQWLWAFTALPWIFGWFITFRWLT